MRTASQFANGSIVGHFQKALIFKQVLKGKCRETRSTPTMPEATREMCRRMNSASNDLQVGLSRLYAHPAVGFNRWRGGVGVRVFADVLLVLEVSNAEYQFENNSDNCTDYHA